MNILNPAQYRYERKFFVPYLSVFQINQLIKLNPANFHEIYNSRQVNNIYYDTLDYTFFHENINGNANRRKIRLRWYGDLYGTIKPKLEVKIKKGTVGTKLIYSIPNMDFRENSTGKEVMKKLLQSDLPPQIKELIKVCRPTLLNSYTRNYYQSICKLYRLTKDINISNYRFMRASRFHSCSKSNNSYTILELKYNSDASKLAERVTNSFPFRLTKFSKYVRGVKEIA